MSEIEPQQAGENVPNEPNYTPWTTQNSAGRDNNGAQSGNHYGDITINNVATEEHELYLRCLTHTDLDEIRAGFVEPGRFHQAARILEQNQVVVLCGAGTGRIHAGTRLLAERFDDIVVHDYGQSLADLRPSDSPASRGYVWDATDRGLTNRDLRHALHLARAGLCRFVIVTDRREQVPDPDLCVRLTPPDPIEVASARIGLLTDDPELPEKTLRGDLADLLAQHDPPQKAVRAAKYAIEVAEGRCTVTDARKALADDVELAVATCCTGWSSLEFSTMLAVALLENRSVEDVLAEAAEFDKLVRTEELTEGRKLKPRKYFAKSAGELLAAIKAETRESRHPRYAGMRLKTVRFERQDWAAASLRHVWREYPLIHELVVGWMFKPSMIHRFGTATLRALCTLTSQMPATDPLWLIRHLAIRNSWVQRDLAAQALVRLAVEHDLRRIVDELLDLWIEHGSANHKWTAAVVFGSAYGQRDLPNALDKLAKIAETDSKLVRNAVIRGVLDMLSRPECRQVAMKRVVEWVERSRRGEGTREVGLALALWITGIVEADHVDLTGIAEEYLREVRFLMSRILADGEFGLIALDRLGYLANRADWDRFTGASPDDAEELVRLATLVAPDLRWWARRPHVAKLVRRHQAYGGSIRSIFRAARKAQR